MALAAGSRLGPYEILAPIGAGGMGEVYRARDLRLARDVAVKILPDRFAADPDRMARFHREAQVLASLNHDRIAHIHGIEESGGIRALILELVEGDTLAERIAREPIPVDEALAIARQIAEALEAAHEKGIVHRDLKPANVKLTPEGRVKVLDFGLAKAIAGDVSSPDVSHSPTLTAAATEAGIVIGTAAYMSPEQARGKPVDKRADIWAFGVVLYEMLAGRKAFEGETVSDTLAAVLRADIDWDALPPETPASVRRVLKRCLERDRALRFHDIADARLEMNEPFTTAPEDAEPSRWARAIPWSIAAICALAAAWGILGRPRPSRDRAPLPVVRVSKALDGQLVAYPKISPDGTRVAFGAWDPTRGYRLMLWRIEESEPRPLPGGFRVAGIPFFSPDGEWLGVLGEDEIRKAALSGGGFVEVAKSPKGGVGACWTADGEIVVGRRHGGLVAIPAAGGVQRDLTTTPDPDVGHESPQVLPGNGAVLFSIHEKKGYAAAIARLSRGRIEGAIRTLVSDAEAAQFVPPGHLVFWRKGGVFAVPFDLSSLTVAGPMASVLRGDVSYDESTYLSVSATGNLVYAPREKVRSLKRLVWVNRTGSETPLDLPARDYTDLGISPDASRVSFAIQEESAPQHVWIHDLKTAASTRLTFAETQNMAPVWTPDGRRIVYVEGSSGEIMSLSAQGAGSPVKLTEESAPMTYPTSWSPDGRVLQGWAQIGTSFDLYTLRCEEPGGVRGPCKSEKLIATEKNETMPYMSPDGRYLAYVSDDSGRNEVYVQAFPGLEGKWQISTAGGTEPRWARNGKELFYRGGAGLMAVPVTVSPAFSFGAPQKLFDDVYVDAGGADDYDVAPDGRFLFMKKVEGTTRLSLELVLNWPTELARLAPRK